MKSMGNLLGYEGWGLTSGEKGLSEVGSGGHQGGCWFTVS